jgi:hypothetical protein
LAPEGGGTVVTGVTLVGAAGAAGAALPPGAPVVPGAALAPGATVVAGAALVTGAVLVVGAAAAVTTIVPCMKLCTRQWYVNVPAAVNVWENDAPWDRQGCVLLGLHVGLESKLPLSAVTLCGVASVFVHVTVLPAATVTAPGWKAKLVIDTGCVVATAVAVHRPTTTAHAAAPPTMAQRARVPQRIVPPCPGLSSPSPRPP